MQMNILQKLLMPCNQSILHCGKFSLDLACHRLKHEFNAASQLLSEMRNMLPKRQKQGLVDKLKSAIIYFKNQRQRMDYNFYQTNNLPSARGLPKRLARLLLNNVSANQE
ncbi:protein of unknown function [Legionella hackeliae]|uniref:Uncharacterized protein n=1 Tax=Legionella hackeliae TaxID=449 RepID=A0A0A8UWW9_LEGHA|nr:protein of unknown function [Legionella hackeliae]